jgi:hypothetical protein
MEIDFDCEVREPGQGGCELRVGRLREPVFVVAAPTLNGQTAKRPNAKRRKFTSVRAEIL